MSKIIPPMVSSSPPPMDDNLDDEDEDDEFGTFSTANFSYDDLDITQPSKPSTNGVHDNNIIGQSSSKNTIHVESTKKDCFTSNTISDFSQQNGTYSPVGNCLETKKMGNEEVDSISGINQEYQVGQEVQQVITSQDSTVSAATDSGMCSTSHNSEETIILPTVEEGVEVYLPCNINQEKSNSTNEISGNSLDSDDEILHMNSVRYTSDATHLADDEEFQSPPIDTNILNDSKFTGNGKLVNCLGQIDVDIIKYQTPILFHDLGNHIIVDDYLKISDSQTKSNDGSVTSVLSDKCINDVKIENITDHSPTSSSRLKQEELQVTDGSSGCEVPFHHDPSKHLSQEINLSETLNSDALECRDQSSFEQVGECDRCDTTKHVGDSSSSFVDHKCKVFGTLHCTADKGCADDFGSFENVSIKPSCEPHESGTFGSSDSLSLPPNSKTEYETSEVVDIGNDFADFPLSETPSLPLATTSVNIKDEPFECDDEFSDFACSVVQTFPLANDTLTKINYVFDADDDFDDFTCSEDMPTTLPVVPANKSNESRERNNEFADFASSVAPSYSSVTASEGSRWSDMSSQICPPMIADQLDDDFDDFETASVMSSTVMPTSIDACQLSSRLENVVTTLFPGPVGSGSRSEFVSRGPMVERNPVWHDLRDVDTSHALTYQWNSSSANKMLLSSLGIDTRNILFGSKWNVTVPRFAANLGVSPLEPVRARSPPLLLPTGHASPKPSQRESEASTSTRLEEIVPDAQFDWNSSGLVNPLDCLEKDGDRTAASSHRSSDNGKQLLTVNTYGSRTGLSSEAVKVLDSLPNLSFLRSKTLVFPPPGQTVLQR